MRFHVPVLSLAVLLAAGWPAAAETPATIDYRGRVTVAGQPFSGEGQFKFALLDPAGKPLWTSGPEGPTETAPPSGSVPLAVADGSYQVRLGDPGAGMPPLPAEVTTNWQSLRIRTWFNDGEHGWAEAGVTALATSGAPAARSAQPVAGDQATLQTILLEVRRLRSEVSLLRKELRSAKSGTTSRSAGAAPAKANPKPKTKPVQVSLADVARPSLGSADAPVVLEEFTDFECGYCKRFFQQTFPQLKEKYIDAGKLRFVSRNYPVKSHPQAGPAAQALLCAAAQKPDQYWAMRAWLFENNRELSDVAYGTYVKEAGLEVPAFLTDYTARRFGPQLDEDVAAARAVGVTGTPSFVLGTSEGKMIDGERIVGAKSFEVFASKIDSLLVAQEGRDSGAAPPTGDSEQTK